MCPPRSITVHERKAGGLSSTSSSGEPQTSQTVKPSYHSKIPNASYSHYGFGQLSPKMIVALSLRNRACNKILVHLSTVDCFRPWIISYIGKRVREKKWVLDKSPIAMAVCDQMAKLEQQDSQYLMDHMIRVRKEVVLSSKMPSYETAIEETISGQSAAPVGYFPSIIDSHVSKLVAAGRKVETAGTSAAVGEGDE